MDSPSLRSQDNKKIRYFHLKPKTEFCQLKLPRNRDILEVFFGLRDKFGELEPKKNIALNIYNQITEIYAKGPFPMKKKDICLKNILKLRDEYKSVTKDIKNYSSDNPSKKISKFKENLDTLCDFSAKNTVEIIMKDTNRSKIQKDEDLKFLEEQKTSWKGRFKSLDKNYTKKCERKFMREQRFVKQKNDTFDTSMKDISSSSSSTNDSSTNSSKNDDTYTTNYFKVQQSRDRSKKRHKSRLSKQAEKKRIMSGLVCGALDRTQTSSRSASELFLSAFCSNGDDIQEMPLSKSSIDRERVKFRKECAAKIKADFVPPKRSIVHFDGKLMSDLSGAYGDRLAIMISGNTEPCKKGFQISGERIADGTGLSQKNEMIRVLKDWKILDNIVGMVFDTCSANTGMFSGAATLLESEINKPLIWLPCRKHILELLLKAAFFDVFGEDMSPVYSDFQEFYNQWDDIKNNIFEGLTISPQWRRKAKKMVDFCNLHLARDKLLRDDYKEIIDLTLVVLGSPPNKFSFKKPGAIHKARWMAPVIYTLKMFLFRHHIDKTESEKKDLERFVKFIVFVYIEHWILCGFASDVTIMDLKLFKDMISWQDYDKSLASAVLKKMERHTWYLNQEFVPLALFSNLITDRQKAKLANMLNQIPSKPREEYDLGHPTELPLPSDKHVALNLELSKLIGNGSMFFFDILGFDREWLNLHVTQWETNESFKEMKDFIKYLKTTNDSAERGVKMISDFANCLTKDDSQRADIIQVVQKHRNFHPDIKKSNFVNIDTYFF